MVWGLAALLLLTMLVWPFFYYPAEAQFMPPDADTAAIPIGGSVLSTLILVTPIVLGLTWFCLRNYRPAGLLVWRRDRPVTSMAATLLFFVLTLPLCWLIATDYLFRAKPLPSYGYYSLPILIVGVVWLATLRTSLVSKNTAVQ